MILRHTPTYYTKTKFQKSSVTIQEYNTLRQTDIYHICVDTYSVPPAPT